MTSSRRITLDALLEALAEDTWENLREAKRLSVRFGEETITDILLLKLRRSGFTVFKQTSTHDEAKYGTDLECWVGSNSTGWVGYAIQAKKLGHRTGTYENLSHTVRGTGKRQIDLLRAYAKARRMTPRYCLYNHSFRVDQAFLNCCSRSYPQEELGCTMTPTEPIETAIGTRGGKRFNSLQRHETTVPWRCLAICPRLRRSLVSTCISSADLSPLLDIDSTIHPRLPGTLGSLFEQGQQQVRPGLPLSSPFEEGKRLVDFEQLGVGVDSRKIGYCEEFSPRFIIPKRVYILESQ